jgi:hypothetical protein
LSAKLGIPAKFEKRTATGVVMDAFLAASALETGHGLHNGSRHSRRFPALSVGRLSEA